MIHHTAVVDPAAKVGRNVSIGPYSVIDAGVTLGDGCRIGPSVHITGDTELGENCTVHKGAVIGDAPQDISYNGFKAYTKIGSGCTIREYVTIHRGSKPEASTIIGNNCMLMAFCHVAHDCQIGNNVVIANNSQIAGHIEVGDKAIISGMVQIHQFCRVGTMSMVGGAGKINQDIPPFSLVDHDSTIVGLNVVGMKRNGFSSQDRLVIREAFKQIFVSGRQRKEAIQELLEKYPESAVLKLYIDFIVASKRGIQKTVQRD
jgi:UDP-N-acetylglucosamine acyltransferase